MKNKKLWLLFLTIIITGIFLLFSIPNFIENKEIESLLTKVDQYLNNYSTNPGHNENNNNSNNGGSGNNNNSSSESNNNSNNSSSESNNNSNNSSSEGNNNSNNSSSEGNNNQPSENKNKFTVSLMANGATISENFKSCETSFTSCEIKLPMISSNKDVLGWSENKDATTATYKPGDIISLTSNKTFYAITKKTVSAIIAGNGAFEGSQTLSCTYYNTTSFCNLSLPSLEKDFYTSFGYNRNVTSDTIEYQENDTVTLNSNIQLYAIRKINTSNYDNFATISKSVYAKLNTLRQERGLPNLLWSKSLELSAMLRISEIAQNYDFNVNGDYHYRISNHKPFYTVNTMAYGENYWSSVVIDAETIHQKFTDSPSHLNNMIRNDVNAIGISVGQINGYYYVVELFGNNN